MDRVYGPLVIPADVIGAQVGITSPQCGFIRHLMVNLRTRPHHGCNLLR